MVLNREQAPRLHGREAECGTLTELVSEVRHGNGGVLVVRGDTGTGKTALLDYADGLAGDLRVVRAAGAEPEAALPYAGLHQLCGSLTGLLGRLPAPRRGALETVFGVRPGAADRFLLGIGVLDLFSEAAADDPLVCLIDDAHWLDQASAQALAFAARRVRAVRVLMIFAARGPVTDLAGLPEMVAGGLREADARGLLASLVPGPLDERVREQIVAETRGIPRQLRELGKLSATQLAGGFGLPSGPPDGISGPRLEQLGDLPPDAGRLLLAAAADPTGDPALLWRAAGHLGVTSEDARPAAEAGLVTFAGRVLFRDRSVRSAVYQSASPLDRRAAHRALALATDPRSDADRRAWHLAQACGEPDEDIAAELERTAPQARSRGGLAALAAFLEAAALITPDERRRAERTVAAAAVMLQAGEPGAAARMLTMAEPGIASDRLRARADLVRARLAVARGHGEEAPRLLLDVARRLDKSDTAEARAAYLDAIRAAAFAAGLAAPGGTMKDVVHAAHDAPGATPPGPPDLLLDGLAGYLGGEFPTATRALRRSLDGFGLGTDVNGPPEELRWLPLACAGALVLWDDSAWDRLSSRFLRLAREAGALGDLPLALHFRAGVRLMGGDLDRAGSLAREARAAAATAGARLAPYADLGLAALRGHADPALALIGEAAADAARRGEGLGVAAAQWAAAMLHNGLGQYGAALAAAEDAMEHAGSPVLAGWPAVELVEAAVRAGQPGRATEAMSALAEAAGAAGSDWSLGIRARSAALLSDAGSAEDHYRAALEHLGRTGARVGLARAHLLYGEWLRRENRRVDAREQLRRAHQMLSAIGADGFAERARRELLATGETVRRRTVVTDRDLTAQETQIAVRARDGQTNTEIGAELFLSPRTVEWHLRKVFTKLGITSRRQLGQALRAARLAGRDAHVLVSRTTGPCCSLAYCPWFSAPRTTRTGQCACMTQCRLTEPISAEVKPPCPRLPTTSRSAPCAARSSTSPG